MTTTAWRWWGAAALLLAACSQSPAGAGLEVIDARLRTPVPGQDKTAGYFTLNNRSRETVVLVGAESPAARSVEMHTSERDGDVMRMRRLTEVVVPAGEAVRFEPGGRHLMLFGVSSLGDATEIVLLGRDGRRIPVTFETIAMGDE